MKRREPRTKHPINFMLGASNLCAILGLNTLAVADKDERPSRSDERGSKRLPRR